jgi:hypothetical protein
MKRVLVAMLAAVALGPAAAQRSAELEALRERAEAARARMNDEHLARGLRQPDAAASEAEAAWARAVRAAVLAEVRSWTAQSLLDGETPELLLSYGAQRLVLGEGLELVGAQLDAAIPEWLRDAMRQRIGELALTARSVEPGLAAGQWTASVRISEFDPPDWSGPTVWSAPAVRDRAASYRSEGGSTTIRVAAGAAPLLWRMAAARGVAARLVLDDTGRELRWNGRLPLRVELRLPVWLVTPQGLVAATLTGARGGSACDGGGWTSLQVAGNSQPAVWAILFLPDAATARAARVQRVAAPPKGPSGADQIGALEVSWAEQRLPALRIVAKRFGDVWGSYAEHVNPPAGKDGAPRLSAAGTPECAPP